MHPLHFTLSIEILNLLRPENIEAITFLEKNLEAVVRKLQHKEIFIFCQFVYKNCGLFLLVIGSFFIFIRLIVRLSSAFFANNYVFVNVSLTIQNICQSFGFIASLAQLLRIFIQVVPS
jgi:hypothetical protein